jgi:hypothetical protein
MLGFKRLGTAALTIAGIELLIHKGQFNLSGLRLKDRSTRSANRRVSQPQAFETYLCHDRALAQGERGGGCDCTVDIA